MTLVRFSSRTLLAGCTGIEAARCLFEYQVLELAGMGLESLEIEYTSEYAHHTNSAVVSMIARVHDPVDEMLLRLKYPENVWEED